MRLSIVLGSFLASSLIIASTAEAQSVTHNAAGVCRGRSAAQNACFDGNNEGWLWFNWSSSGTCNASTMPLVCGLEDVTCTDMAHTKRFSVDGNCSSSMNCYLRVVNYTDGTSVAGYPMSASGGPGNFHMNVYAPCADLSTRNSATVQCDVPVGCKIWAIRTLEY